MGVFGDCEAAVTHTGLRWRSRADHFDETGWGRFYSPANSASHLQTCSVALSALQATRLHTEAFIRAVRHHVQLSSAHLSRKPFQKRRRRGLPLFIKGPTPPRSASGHPKTYKRLFVLYSFFTQRLSLFFQTHSLLLFQALMTLHSFHSRTPTADCSVSFGAALGDPSSFSTDSARHLLSALFPCSPRPRHIPSRVCYRQRPVNQVGLQVFTLLGPTLDEDQEAIVFSSLNSFWECGVVLDTGLETTRAWITLWVMDVDQGGPQSRGFFRNMANPSGCPLLGPGSHNEGCQRNADALPGTPPFPTRS